MINYLQVENLTKSYGDLVLFDNISFTIGEGQRIALIGRNGSGKTTLLNILAGKDTADSGTITPRRDLRIAYLEQNPEYAADLTVLEACFRSDNPALRAIAAYEQAVADPVQNGLQEAMSRMDALAAWDYEQRAKEILSRLKINDFDKKIGQLSGGQLKRVALAAVLISEADLLILDEPTNHMDMRSKDILKNAIMKYDGTVIVVSHDREFLDGMVSKVYEFRNGGVREYLGGIYYFLEKRKLESLQEVERKDAPAKEAAPKASSSGKLTYEQKKEQEKLLRKLRKAVETIEASLADLEKKIADYDRKFAEATQYNEADYKAYNELKAEYDHQMHEWEKASYELEITEGE